VNELERAAVGLASLVDAIEPAKQLGARRVQVVVAVELEAVDEGECGLHVAGLGHRGGLVELDDEPVTRASSRYRAASCDQFGDSSTWRIAIVACST